MAEKEEQAAAMEADAKLLWQEAHRLNGVAVALPDQTEAIRAVELHIADADKVNAELEPWKEYDRTQAEAKEAGKEAEKLTAELKDLDAEEGALLKAADIPVRGISFAEDGSMLLDGHPLEVASGMRRLDMTVDVAFAANPKVRICLLDEANDYGLDALARLNERAVAERFQVFPCRLGLEGPGEIVVKDGAAKGGGA